MVDKNQVDEMVLGSLVGGNRLTVISGGAGDAASIVISGKAQPYPKGLQYGYWLLVIDRKKKLPEVVASAMTNDPTVVPSAISQYGGSSGHILVVATRTVAYENIPQGELYKFLAENGSGAVLERLEQIAEDAGSAAGGAFVYAMVGIMDDASRGFESFSFNTLNNSIALALALENFGGVWTPVKLQG